MRILTIALPCTFSLLANQSWNMVLLKDYSPDFMLNIHVPGLLVVGVLVVHMLSE